MTSKHRGSVFKFKIPQVFHKQSHTYDLRSGRSEPDVSVAPTMEDSRLGFCNPTFPPVWDTQNSGRNPTVHFASPLEARMASPQYSSTPNIDRMSDGTEESEGGPCDSEWGEFKPPMSVDYSTAPDNGNDAMQKTQASFAPPSAPWYPMGQSSDGDFSQFLDCRLQSGPGDVSTSQRPTHLPSQQPSQVLVGINRGADADVRTSTGAFGDAKIISTDIASATMVAPVTAQGISVDVKGQVPESGSTPPVFSLRDLPAPGRFYGNPTDCPEDFLKSFLLWAGYRRLTSDENALISSFALLLADRASGWFHSLPADTVATWDKLKSAFLERFSRLRVHRFKDQASLWAMRQSSTQCVDEFVSDVRRRAELIGVSEATVFDVALNGVKSSVQQFLLHKEVKTLEELLKYARSAEHLVAVDPIQGELLTAVQDIQTRLQRLDARSASPVANGSPNPRRVTFGAGTKSDPDNEGYSSENRTHSSRRDYQSNHDRGYNQNFSSPAAGPRQFNSPGRMPRPEGRYQGSHPQQNFGGQQVARPFPQRNRVQYYPPSANFQNQNTACGNCGYTHGPRCPARGLTCLNCGRLSHFSRMCRSTQRQPQAAAQ